MINAEQMYSVLDTLPDPVFILTREGRYVGVFGGKDARYYHDGKGLVGHRITDLIKPIKAQWFLEQIQKALSTKSLLIVEYELSNKDVKGLPNEGPDEPIWFEGRVQSLDFKVDDDDVVLWVASNISERHCLEVQLREMSDTDQLTGLYNRRKLERDLILHFEAFTRYGIPTAMLMFDLDNLKVINDSLGHLAGDKLIQTLAITCSAELRTNDIACRFGGDEFVIAMPALDQEQALQLAKRLHQRFIEALSDFAAADTKATVSMGVVSMSVADTTYLDVLHRADTALYQAKHQGKNRIVSA
ncbi:diguanylate cyclase PdgB [Nitrincola alkalisediminis]